MAETRQLEAAYSREYQSHSAPIEEVGACNKARGHLAMQNEIMIQGEEGEQNRMAGGGAGQHTTQTSKTLPKDSIKIYRVKRGGQINVGKRTSTSDTPAAAATGSTPSYTRSKRPQRDGP